MTSSHGVHDPTDMTILGQHGTVAQLPRWWQHMSLVVKDNIVTLS